MAPLFFVSFGLGIVLGFYFSNFWLFVGVAVICMFFVGAKNLSPLRSDIFILLLFICLGAVWAIPVIKQSRVIDDLVGTRFIASSNICPIAIKIITIPQQKSTRNTCYAIIRAIHELPLQKKVKVFDYTRQLEYLRTYRVGVDGVGPKYKISCRNYQGRPFYTLWIKKDAAIKSLPSSFWNKCAIAATNYTMSVFKNNLSDQAYRFMSSVFLGRRELLGNDKEVFINAGVAHLLAISGLHMGITTLAVFFILGVLGIKFRSKLLISLVFLCSYTIITGASASSVRAVAMYAVFVFGFFLQRKVSSFNSLSLAGLISLVINPMVLFEVGFQLSFLAVFSLIIGYEIFHPKTIKPVVANYIRQIIFSSTCVALFTAPLIAYYFGRVYLMSILYNVALIPYFAMILTINFVMIVLSPITFFAQSLGVVLSWLVSGFIMLTGFLGGGKFSFFHFRATVAQLIAFYFLLILLIFKKTRTV
ncbi:MAG: ComEC/Rec2 family competence protein [Candidatus Omnitrophica bacterium]|nr:ComEC/Rec2 family competence protein [Candidatus Omnitrophota bacterium]